MSPISPNNKKLSQTIYKSSSFMCEPFPPRKGNYRDLLVIKKTS